MEGIYIMGLHKYIMGDGAEHSQMNQMNACECDVRVGYYVRNKAHAIRKRDKVEIRF